MSKLRGKLHVIFSISIFLLSLKAMYMYVVSCTQVWVGLRPHP